MASPPEHPDLHVWRVSNYADLSGRGGLIAPGRWHSRGHAVVYCSDTVGHAMDEIEKQLSVTRYMFPSTYKVLDIHIPKRAKIIAIERCELPDNWQDDYYITQIIGDKWFKSMSSAVLCIPSGVGTGNNYVINTAHRDSDYIEIAEVFGIDEFIYR